MTDELEDLMEPELKEIYLEVKSEISEQLHNSEINTLTLLEEKDVDTFCKKYNLVPPEHFKKEMKTVFALAKFIQLHKQNTEIQNRIKADLTNFIDETKISWTLYNDFSNTIVFTKILAVNSDEKPQNLSIKYRLDIENDEIIYTLPGTWGWDITKYQLKALLENKTMSSFNNEQIEFITTSQKDSIKISAGKIEVLIKKG